MNFRFSVTAMYQIDGHAPAGGGDDAGLPLNRAVCVLLSTLRSTILRVSRCVFHVSCLVLFVSD